MSPRAPTSVSNLQQPQTPIDHLLLDKNTPAPTPTDQHDNKSITASPYIHPTPSVEPPPSVEGMGANIGGAVGGPGSVPQPPSVGRCTPTAQQHEQQQLHQQQQSQQQQQQQAQQQQQCGSISVKKFDIQPALTPLCNPLGVSTSNLSNMMNSTHISNNNVGSTQLNSNKNFALTRNNFLNLYNPPKLNLIDMDTFANEDCLKLEVLYDFTVQDAW